jgi:LAS superfamily LD-carboxypeptidase LdcB
MADQIETQVSGKYGSNENPNQALFDFKQKLVDTGFVVDYPAGHGMVDSFNTTEEEKGKSFHAIEHGFLMSVKKNPLHVVYNIWQDNDGYVGRSAAVEIAMAMREKHPVVLVRPPVLNDSIPEELRNLIQQKVSMLHINNLDNLSSEELKDYCLRISQEKTDYDLTSEERDVVTRNIMALLREQKMESET